MMRGDVFWHKFKEPDKKRPVLIITRTEAILELNSVTVIPTTTNIRNILSQILLTEEDGLIEPCVLNVDWIQTVPADKLQGFITHLSEERMAEVFEAVKFAFDFDK